MAGHFRVGGNWNSLPWAPTSGGLQTISYIDAYTEGPFSIIPQAPPLSSEGPCGLVVGLSSNIADNFQHQTPFHVHIILQAFPKLGGSDPSGGEPSVYVGLVRIE